MTVGVARRLLNVDFRDPAYRSAGRLPWLMLPLDRSCDRHGRQRARASPASLVGAVRNSRWIGTWRHERGHRHGVDPNTPRVPSYPGPQIVAAPGVLTGCLKSRVPIPLCPSDVVPNGGHERTHRRTRELPCPACGRGRSHADRRDPRWRAPLGSPRLVGDPRPAWP